jgi:hypothetical protein
MYKEEDNEIHDLLKFVSIRNIIMNCPLHFFISFLSFTFNANHQGFRNFVSEGITKGGTHILKNLKFYRFQCETNKI